MKSAGSIWHSCTFLSHRSGHTAAPPARADSVHGASEQSHRVATVQALTGLWLLQGRRIALTSSACLHSLAAANSHMPPWPAPAQASRPGPLPLLLWTLTLDRPLVTQSEIQWLPMQPSAEQDTAQPDSSASHPPPSACPGILVISTLFACTS